MNSVIQIKDCNIGYNQGFQIFELQNGCLATYNDGVFKTTLFGFVCGGIINLPDNYTHFGIVVDGKINIITHDRTRILEAGDFFSINGNAIIESCGKGMVTSAPNYVGFNVFGGPVEKTGRLRYIDGCTDTLLVPPVRLGDPCFNHLHFPPGIIQTPHTHPSVRTGVVLRGSGVCRTPNDDKKVHNLVPCYAFIIKTGVLHSFDTKDSHLDIIAFHPDSDTGMTDDNHPMVNRTIVDGVSSSKLESIRTK